MGAFTAIEKDIVKRVRTELTEARSLFEECQSHTLESVASEVKSLRGRLRTEIDGKVETVVESLLQRAESFAAEGARADIQSRSHRMYAELHQQTLRMDELRTRVDESIPRL